MSFVFRGRARVLTAQNAPDESPSICDSTLLTGWHFVELTSIYALVKTYVKDPLLSIHRVSHMALSPKKMRHKMYIVLYLRLLELYYDCKAVNGGRRVLRFLDHYSIFCYNSLLIHPVVSTHFCTYVTNLPTSYTPMLKRISLFR